VPAIPSITAEDLAMLNAVEEIRLSLRHALARPRRWRGTLRRQAQARAVRGSDSVEGITVIEDQVGGRRC
jgi:hypothetical protein